MLKLINLLLLLLLMVTGCTKKSAEPELYGQSDTVPPCTITNLAILNVTPSRVTLSWTTPGDDSLTGKAYMYDARYSTSPLNDSTWSDGIPWRTLWFVYKQEGEYPCDLGTEKPVVAFDRVWQRPIVH